VSYCLAKKQESRERIHMARYDREIFTRKNSKRHKKDKSREFIVIFRNIRREWENKVKEM
jgi:hypothetical protein